MSLTLFQYILVFAVTFFGEWYGAIVGGGGFVVQPFLMSLGIPPHMAVSHDVGAASGTSLGSYLVFKKKDLIRPDLLKFSFSSSIIGALVGLILLVNVSPNFIEKFVAVLALVFLIYTLFFKPNLGASEKPLPKHSKVHLTLFGFILGVYATFSGAGSGTFATYYMTSILGSTFLQALGAQSVLFFLTMLIGLAGYIYLGLIQWKLLLVMMAATILAGIYGAKCAIWIGDKWLRPIFICAVLGFSAYLLFK